MSASSTVVTPLHYRFCVHDYAPSVVGCTVLRPPPIFESRRPSAGHEHLRFEFAAKVDHQRRGFDPRFQVWVRVRVRVRLKVQAQVRRRI